MLRVNGLVGLRSVVRRTDLDDTKIGAGQRSADRTGVVDQARSRWPARLTDLVFSPLLRGLPSCDRGGQASGVELRARRC